MKRRIVDEIVVGVKQQDSSVGGPATTPSLAGGVFASGTRGPAAASAAGPGVLGGRQAHSPAPQLLHQGPSNPCMLTTGPTVVQNVRANSPAVKSDLGGPTMPGSLTYPVQGYQSSSMSASNPNPTLKGTSGGLQGGLPVVGTGGASTSSSHPPTSGHGALLPAGLGSGGVRHKAPRPSGGLARSQQQRGRSSSHDPPPSSQVHQGGNSVPLTPAQQSQQQQQQFQRLKVEDALSYLDQVKEKFGNQPQVYNNFLDIMKEFKSQSIDTPGVIARVSNLFKGHPELIVGFNTFLPPGYKIEVQSNDQGFAFQVSVSMPSPTNTTSVGSITHHHTLPISSGPSTPVAATPTPTISIPVAAPAVNTPSVVSGGPIAALSQTLPPPSAAASVPPIPIKPVTLPSGPIGLAAVHHAATSLHGYSSSVPASSSPHHPPSGAQPPSMPVPSAPSSGSSGGGGPSSLLAAQSGHAGAQMLAESMQPTPQSQPVDFTHAINYVNKIKNRFQGQPDKYKSFLDILHAYQKEQRSLKEGLATPGKHLTEAEVYSQVAKLFENQEDLVQEFGQFLPDATSHQAALMGAVLQGNKGLANDHTSAKKPLSLKPSFNNASAGLAALSMGVGAISANSKFGQQVKRSPSFSTSSQPPAKKPKMVSLRDVSLADAGKYGSLNDYAYFDKVRKALKSQEVYENFLRCLVLFNQEVVSSSELVQLVTPFLGRFPELLRWIKEFLGHVESSSSTAAGGTSTYQSLHSSALNDVGSNNVGRQDRTAGDHAMEIDYSTCKRLGASYCALPKSYILPKCSGRSQLCKEVLNDTWVSFPTWSEDSTFVTSRKTQYEEYIYRCEDERFELDVVLETNAATIRVLEGVNKKMQRMQPEEMAKFHLDEHLGGTSTTIHQRALRRIYGDKAPDIIMGLKKNPSAAVPVVLRRLKAKEEEWREAQKGFNKIWREQNEKYYLKSLDHQGINFKQNDVKALRSKALFNEIETLYDERHEQAEEGANEVASGPHLVLPYRDKSVLDDAANLLIHHVKRQTGIHKEDKQHIKQMLRHFIPDLFFHPRQELSDDEREDDMQEDQEDGEGSNQGGKSTNNNGSSSKASKSEPEVKKEAETEIKAAAAAAAPPGATPTPAKPSSQCGSVSSGSNSSNSSNAGDKETLALPPHAISSLPDEHYTLFMASNTWYLFLRLHQILCERLTRMYERAMSLAAEEAQNKLDRKESTAVALRLKPKNDIEVEDYYPAFLDMVKNVLDGNMESNAYEDTLREMFGIHAYIAFTLDKVVTYAVRQLQSLVVDESSQECFEMFLEEQKKGAAGGACSQAAHNLSVEMAYQRRAEQALAEENCYKVYIYKRDCRLTIELLDSEVEEPEAATEGEKGASYLEKYVSGLDTLSEDVRERLARKPVFLPRNVRHYQRRGGNTEPMEVDENPKEQDSKADVKDESKDKASNSSNNEGEGKEKRPSESPPPPGSQAESVDGTECKFNLSSYTRVYVVDKESIMYKREALLKAKESHPAVSRKLSRLFRAWHRSWADEHVSEEQQKQSTEWLMGLGENVIPNRTRIVTNNDLSRPPYCRYNRYRVERLAEPPAQASSTSSGAPSSS